MYSISKVKHLILVVIGLLTSMAAFGQGIRFAADTFAGRLDEIDTMGQSISLMFGKSNRMNLLFDATFSNLEGISSTELGVASVWGNQDWLLGFRAGRKELSHFESHLAEAHIQYRADQRLVIAAFGQYESRDFGSDILSSALQMRFYVTDRLLLESGIASNELRQEASLDQWDLIAKLEWQPGWLDKLHLSLFAEEWVGDAIFIGLRFQSRKEKSLFKQHWDGPVRLLR